MARTRTGNEGKKTDVYLSWMDIFTKMILIIIVIVLAGLVVDQNKSLSICKNATARYGMYNVTNQMYVIKQGVYFSDSGDDSYYCVWTGGRTREEIFNTTVHEECHDLVYRANDHFCKNDR